MSDPAALFDLLGDASMLTVVCHNNPDPDCLASALALGRIAAAAGLEDQRTVYGGDISHQQNRAFVNLLDLSLEPFELSMVRDRDPGDLIAFVDHSTPGANNDVPEGTEIDVVVDHHSASDVKGTYVDHRPDAGATATIMTEYVRTLEIDVDEALATALLFAIRRETLGFLRGTTAAEYDAAGWLHPAADVDLLGTLSSPSVSGATIDAIGEAIENRTVRGAVLISHVGRTGERDSLPQAADYLATLEGVETAIVFGIVGNTIQLSARSSDSRVHIGDALAAAFGDVGSAGGHQEMAGAELPLGIFAGDTDASDDLVDIAVQVVTARLVAELNLAEDGASTTESEE